MSLKIYTKTGDDGTTGLFGGTRVGKDASRIEAYGDVDELNSLIGVARSFLTDSFHRIDSLLGTIQDDLFVLGADLATPVSPERKQAPLVPRISEQNVQNLEHAIDELERELPELKNFIHPGGSTPGAMLHLARTVCRRAERNTVRLYHEDSTIGLHPIQYLNRLSDILFVMARYSNHITGTAEHIWKPKV